MVNFNPIQKPKGCPEFSLKHSLVVVDIHPSKKWQQQM